MKKNEGKKANEKMKKKKNAALRGEEEEGHAEAEHIPYKRGIFLGDKLPPSVQTSHPVLLHA